MDKLKFFDINIKLFFSIFLLLLLFDAIYITIFKNIFIAFYKKVQGGRDIRMKYGGLVAIYLFMTSIIYYFGIIKKFTLGEMFILGVSIYGVYELTNYTTLIDWNLKMVILDTTWGGLLYASTLFFIKKLN